MTHHIIAACPATETHRPFMVCSCGDLFVAHSLASGASDLRGMSAEAMIHIATAQGGQA